MAPKNTAKGGDKKGKGKDASEGDKGKGGGGKGLKPATSINVRHILVRKFFLWNCTSLRCPRVLLPEVHLSIPCIITGFPASLD
jgi:hypothetical protein